ncbi:MAG: hypothetical protein SFZ24_13040 [Planctomycetota bacterium]|nr:hypothetical protein [Planctomycetota bacterium]
MAGRAGAHELKIDRLMEEASLALAEARYTDCERIAREALEAAHLARDFDRLARVVLPLQEARRQRRLAAVDTKKLHRLSTASQIEPFLTGTERIEPGCYLIEPTLVAMDGRELRDRALADGVLIFVLVREPQTKLGQWPLVAVGPATVRARVAPPKRVTISWVEQAGEALGDAALELVDPTEPADDRVDHLMDLLSTVVDHEKLHQALLHAAQEAHRESLAEPKRGRRRGAKPEPEEELSAEEEEL